MVQLGRSWLFAWGALLSYGISADAKTITGPCIELMDGGFRKCEQLMSDFSVLPECCAAVGAMNKMGCFTVPAVAGALAQDPNWAMNQTFASMCNAQLDGELWGKQYEPTYNMGCANLPDEQVDALRMNFLNSFYYWFEMGRFADADDYDTYRASQDGLKALFTKTDGSQVLMTGFGLGRFTDSPSSAEYFALAQPYAAKHNPMHTRFWGFPGAQRKTSKVLFGCNSAVFEEVTDATTDLADPYEYWSSYRFDFEPCSGQLTHIFGWVPEKMLEELIEDYTSNETVAINYCEEVMTQCTGTNQVYTSQQDCLDYFNSLPAKADGCKHQTMGNSKICRLKHHFLMFERPDLHCFHVSKGMADVTGKTKCTQAECDASNDLYTSEFTVTTLNTASPPFIGKYGGIQAEPPKEEDWGVNQCAGMPPSPPGPPGGGQCVEITQAMKQLVEAQGFEPRLCK